MGTHLLSSMPHILFQHFDRVLGCAVVDWLLKWSFITSREDGISLVDDLIQLAHIQQLSPFVENEESKGKFIDSNDSFYRFVSIFNS